jgi:16S rRNA (adenine(1408)-N(1))-methyltransferase
LTARYGGRVTIDLGTGDGLFVCRSARENPDRFHIGIDINAAALRKISQKIYRKPAKGGLPNALFVQSSVEDLPAELNDIADRLYVNFPWGSLLRAVAVGDVQVLGNIRRICARSAFLETVLGVDPERDHAEIERLGLGELTPEYVEGVLSCRYRSASFDITEISRIPTAGIREIDSSWARRLTFADGRSFIRIRARAV